ncbi:hypothetical protein [Streptomyces sp. NPDC057382]
MAVAPLRRGLSLDEPRERPPSPRETARWITTRPDRRSPHSTERLHRLLAHCPELQRTHGLVVVRQFTAMLNHRDAAPLSTWLDKLSRSGLAPLIGIAGALRDNEGRITDLKLQKRLMAGRAGVPLLRHRVVLIAHLRRRYADRPTPAPR